MAGVRAPQGQDVSAFTAHAADLLSAGADLLAVTGQEASAARVSPVAAAVVLREHAGADVVLSMETAGRSLAALEADMLGAYALGVQTVVCRSGTPRVAGDYPDPFALGDVDSVRLISALAGLNEGADWRGVTTPDRTRFVIGGSLHTAPADMGQELGRSEEKMRAGAHFLLTDVIYDTDSAVRMLSELRARGVELPVIASFAPFEDPKTITQLFHEVPGVSSLSSLAAAGSTGEERAEPVVGVLDSISSLGGLVAGVLIQAPNRPDDRMASLVSRLVSARRAS
jgi:homocysteine S-methyltransferase